MSYRVLGSDVYFIDTAGWADDQKPHDRLEVLAKELGLPYVKYSPYNGGTRRVVVTCKTYLDACAIREMAIS
jgi:hypothetical protein